MVGEGDRKTMEALRVESLSKRFGGLRVLENLSFKVDVGERIGILGPNGAGKSTLFNLLDGRLRPSGGSIYVFGQDVTNLPRHRRVSIGVARSYQLNTLFQSLTVFEHVLLAVAGAKPGLLPMFRATSHLRHLFADVELLLEQTDLAGRASTLIDQLSYGEQRRLEFALALAANPKLLLLDEPTCGLSAGESQSVLRILQSLPKDVTILLVTHDIDLAFEGSRRILVLHYGSIIADGDVRAIAQNEEVKEIYLGTGGAHHSQSD